MPPTISGAIVGDDARAFLEDAYRNSGQGDGAQLEHPLAVARLLHDYGQRRTVLVAGLLHDVLEDTEVTANELQDRFGPEVTRLVEALTQDASIPQYGERKDALRRQILDAGRDAATIALADKVAKVEKESDQLKQRQIEHYRATLDGIEERYGRTALGERLRAALERLPD